MNNLLEASGAFPSGEQDFQIRVHAVQVGHFPAVLAVEVLKMEGLPAQRARLAEGTHKRTFVFQFQEKTKIVVVFSAHPALQ